MSSPFLDLAVGALGGVQANREAQIAAEERRRKRQAEDLERRMMLAKLAEQPDFDITELPYLNAATAAPSGEPAGMQGPPAGAPSTGPAVEAGGGAGPAVSPPPGIPPVGGASVGRPAAEAGIGGPPPTGVPAPPAPPAAPTGAPATPFLDRALDLGTLEAGGKQYGLTVHPGRKRARGEATNRAAYDALHRADPEAYPEYIAGMPEGYYAEELSDYAQGVRAGRIADRRAAHEGRAAASRQAVEARRDAARDRVFSLAQEGKTFEDVVAAMAQDHELRGVLTRSEIRREMQSAGQINAPDREKAQRMSALKTQLGKPPLPPQGAAAISAEEQQEIIEALADGDLSADEIVQGYQKSGNPVAATVRRWLRRGRQLAPPAPTPGQ